ncbi:Fc receptor-like A [Delphinapterus leucas]|uniref:High affinity immunoglobulin gamma Fc receptor I n=2 Tax=Monodontidae TaxID=9747 RepID=A0A7F8K8I9_DELLE|nr:Fc receptor-like A [Delphinapterus leucas]
MRGGRGSGPLQDHEHSFPVGDKRPPEPLVSASPHLVTTEQYTCEPVEDLRYLFKRQAPSTAPVAGKHAGLPKAVVNIQPAWINVLKEDYVTLMCQGTNLCEGNLTLWFHNGSFIQSQNQSSYSFKASSNDSGDYRCQREQTSLSDPVHLYVTSDWLLLQTPSLVFQEGEPIVLRCHSWRNSPLNKVIFFQNGRSKTFSHLHSNFSIPQANLSHSGEYHCTGFIGHTVHSSQPVTITVQGSSLSNSLLVTITVAVVAWIAAMAVAGAIVAWFCLRRKKISALPGTLEHREMGETLPEEPGECSSPSGGSMTPCLVHQEAACVSSAGSTGEGGGSGQRAGAQISWSVLRLTPGPKEDLTGDKEKMKPVPDREARALSEFLGSELLGILPEQDIRDTSNLTDAEEAAKMEIYFLFSNLRGIVLKKISVLEAAGDLNTVTMKLGCVLMAGAFYFSPAILWAAQMLLAGCHAVTASFSGSSRTMPSSAASFEALQCEGPVSTQEGSCHTEDDLTDPREVDFQVKGYTFSEPFHLIVSYDWLILQSPAWPIFEGDPLVLRCQAWQDWPLTQVTFYQDGSALGPPGPNKEFSIAVAQKADSGHYHCSAIFRSPGPGSPETASPVAITVQELFRAPVLRATPSAEPQEGSPVTLSCQTKLPLQRSAAHLLFSFYKDSRTVRSRGPSSEFQIPTASEAHSGSYWCEATTEDNQVWKQSPKLEIRVQGPSSSAAPPTLNPAPQKSATPETTSKEPPGPLPPLPTPSSKDLGSSSPLHFPDPHLHHQMRVLLKQMQDMRVILGHLVMELRDLSGHLKLQATKGPAKY